MNKLSSHISLLLVSTILVLTCWQSYTVLNFYAHQAEIEAEFCENIDQPELGCHGQCHLKKQLTTKIIKKDTKRQVVQSSLIVFQSFETLLSIDLEYPESKNKPRFLPTFSLKDGVLCYLLDPPELIN